MLIITAHNITGTKEDGTSDYNIEVKVTETPTKLRTVATFQITGHIRSDGWQPLVRRISDYLEHKDGR